MPDSVPPPVKVIQTIQAFIPAFAVHAAARHHIADALHPDGKSAAELAEELGFDEGALSRILRALASIGIFSESSPGFFENSEVSHFLRSDVPGSVRSYAAYGLHAGNVRAWLHVDSTLETGEPSFEAANGKPFWPYLAEHPDVEREFDQAMVGRTRAVARFVVDAYDFQRAEKILDVGGGHGALVAAIAEANPNVTACTFERPELADAHEQLDTNVEMITGDFFEELPSGFDVYLLKDVLHDWSDDDALRILRRCHDAMDDESRLLVLDSVLPEGDAPHPARWLDLHMMVALGGRERTREEFEQLYQEANLELESLTPLPAPPSVQVLRRK